MKQKYFLVYTLWFASQIEFSDWDWLDLNIISRTIAVIHQFNMYLIFSRSFHFSNQHKTSCLHGRAPYEPKYNFSFENNVVGWMTISLIKNYVVFPVTISNCFPHCPSTSVQISGFQNLKLKQAAGTNYGSIKAHRWKFPDDLSQAEKASVNSSLGPRGD